ncbi:ribosome small subunit-dependent GTPase A [Pararhizobium antarcticum]|uniref:Small ribosomal subunit biogenesis GTPase RsgA n=1 Tax=Pararhizobium antarcticum TaxID=1798805 RepID=A0A657LVY9_9HYPH|nr:ribosome small subunit-dependent GTPase A [Pararhizobium antarcticum]OJF89783.1 GTPase RsgA [Rhizobium sp. 58]OJF99732.1 GTPase RsgA [Pararhizobium antarcticum]
MLVGDAEPGGIASLETLGWSGFFADQVVADDPGCVPARIARVHRTRLVALAQAGEIELELPNRTNTADYAVGDWVTVETTSRMLVRRLDRKTLLQRRTEGRSAQQLAAANVDTLFIVTSCNADFNPARLERYLALANQGDIVPVILLTKADTADDAETYRSQAMTLQRGLDVVVLDARSGEVGKTLAPWCGTGATVALVGSSGVGKSTLVNSLAGLERDARQKTGGIRESDAKGRHTTTARSLHAIEGGGWVIDTPGLRTLHVSDSAEGIDALFSEITDLAPQCRFRDCTHDHEPGCAVQAAVRAGTLDADRLARWRKLTQENRTNTPVMVGARGNKSRAR